MKTSKCDALSQKTVELSQKEVEVLAKDRQQLEQVAHLYCSDISRMIRVFICTYDVSFQTAHAGDVSIFLVLTKSSSWSLMIVSINSLHSIQVSETGL